MTSVALTSGHDSGFRRLLVRNGWVLGVWLLLGVLLFWYSTLIPRFGQFQVVSITKNSLPLIYLAIGQAIIVIAGGIDLSLGSLLLLGNVLAPSAATASRTLGLSSPPWPSCSLARLSSASAFASAYARPFVICWTVVSAKHWWTMSNISPFAARWSDC